MRDKLSGDARNAALGPLLASGWTMIEDRDAIARTFKFRNFAEAFGWMTTIAILAEKMDHHPEWSNVYRTVDVVLTTHSTGGISQLDIDLAQQMTVLADRYIKA